MKPRKDNLAHYQAIAAEAERVGWPTRFRTDLTKHDRGVLAEHEPSKPFTWILRETGTHIAFPGVIDGVGHTASQYARMVAESFAPAPCRFYLWDGRRIVEYADPAELDARMADLEIELGITRYGRAVPARDPSLGRGINT